MKFTYLLLGLFFVQFTYGQNETKEGSRQFLDSNFFETKNGVKDSLQTIQIQRAFFKYVYNKPSVAKSIADEAIRLEEGTKFPYGITRFYLCRGIYYDVIGKKDSAFIDYDAAFTIAEKNNDENAMASVYTNKGLIEWNRENPEKALEYYLLGLEMFQKSSASVGSKIGIASTMNNIGLLLRDLKRYEDSNDYFHKSLKLSIEADDGYGVGAAYSNIANNHGYLKNRDSTFFYLSKSIAKQKRNKNKRGLSIDYTNLGQEYLKSEQIDSALYYIKAAATINDSMNANNLKKENLKTLARIYFKKKNNPYEGLKYYQKSLKVISKDSTYRVSRYKIYQEMSDAYFVIKDFEKASIYRRKASLLRDTIINQNQRLATAEIIEKYESEKKEKEIISQRAQLTEKELEVRKKNNLVYGLGGGALLLGLLGYLFYNQQRLKNRQQVKEYELEKALVKIETQNRLQEQRLRISRDLHDNIGSQLTFITSSLDNLKYGMKAEEVKTKEKLTEIGSFTKTTINELRDTIWAMNKEKITFEDLEARLVNLLDQARTASPETNFDLIISPEINRDDALSSVEGMNLYRIIQEAINNAIKYAEANRITVTLSRNRTGEIHDQRENKVINRTNLEATIVDNGKGFNTESPELGNGLTNMKKRINEIQGEIDIVSSIGEGTTVKFRFPIAINTSNDV